MSSSERDPVTGYTDEEFDAELVRTQRSDWGHVARRSVTLVVVYAILAHGIRTYDLTAGLVLLPLAVEVLTVFWLGLFMARFVVACPAFRKSGGKPILTLFWTATIIGIAVVMLAWDREAGSFDSNTIGPAYDAAVTRIFESGLVWALVAMVVGLIADTVPEVLRWRRVGGVFVWTSIVELGMRLATFLLIGIAGFFVVAFLADASLFDTQRGVAWVVFGFLLLVDAGGLALGTAMHRDLSRKARTPGEAQPFHRRTLKRP